MNNIKDNDVIIEEPVKRRRLNISITQKQFMKYIFVGGLTALLELMLFAIFRLIAFFDIALSNIIAVTTATLCNFFLNRGWSFKANSNIFRNLILYVFLFLINLSFSTYAIAFMVKAGMVDVVAKLVTMILITLWNFVLYRKVIFK